MKKYLFALILPLSIFAADQKNIEIYESPTCGCCDLWANYMEKQGYHVKITKTNDFLKIKEQLGIKDEYQSCHTGIINGYAIEGHVPQDAISWLLKNKPKDIIGISAPGMPQGSPGMEQGYYEEYPVILMKKDGDYQIYGYFKGDKLIKKLIP